MDAFTDQSVLFVQIALIAFAVLFLIAVFWVLSVFSSGAAVGASSGPLGNKAGFFGAGR